MTNNNEAIEALENVRKEFYEMANEAEANDLYMIEFDAMFKQIRKALQPPEGYVLVPRENYNMFKEWSNSMVGKDMGSGLIEAVEE